MIDVQNLCKDYILKKKDGGLKGALKGLVKREHIPVHAVKDLSFHIDPGEIVGFIGPNGAGKSTTIKMMSGILTPTKGSVLIDGRDITRYRKEVVRNIGVVFGQRSQLNWDLRLQESFELLKHIYQIDQKDYDQTLDVMDEILGIKEIMGKPVRQMSLGQRVKGDLVASMLHSPKVLFLDEPTIGLDVSMKSKIRELILGLNKEKNTTVILTTHDMGDVDALCRRIVIIDKGMKIYDNDIDHLKNYFGSYRTLKLKLADDTWEEMLIDEKTTDVMDVIMAKQKESKIKDVKILEISTEEVIKKIYEGSAK